MNKPLALTLSLLVLTAAFSANAADEKAAQKPAADPATPKTLSF
jgi:hypothetical protein